MTDTSLRARSTSEIVDAAFSLYRQNVPKYTVVTAVCYAPSLIISLLMSGTVAAAAADPMGAVWKLLPVYFVSMVTAALVSGAIAHMGSAAYLGEEPDVGRTLSAVLPRVPALLLSSLVLFVMMIPTAILLFLPVLYIVARFFAVTPAIVLENKGAFAALGRSSVLSKGRKWKILGALLLTGGIYIALSIAISATARAIGGVVLSLVVSSLFAVFAYPIVHLVILVLYYDCRIRSEGFDVEHMSRSLGVPGTPAPMGSPLA